MCYKSCPNGSCNSTSINFICEEDTINDIIENNICNNWCNVINFLNNTCSTNKDDIINKIRKAILNGLCVH